MWAVKQKGLTSADLEVLISSFSNILLFVCSILSLQTFQNPLEYFTQQIFTMYFMDIYSVYISTSR